MTTMTISYLIRIASQYRAYVRAQTRAPHHVPVTVVDGTAAPALTGESYHYETRGGRRVYHPSAYAKKGWSNLVYCPSTISVEVGRDWLTARRIPEWAMTPARDIATLVARGACGPAGQAGLVFDMSPERIVEEIGIQESRYVEARA